MSMVTRRLGILEWGGASFQLRQSVIPALFARHAHTRADGAHRKAIIGPELRRELLEKRYRSQEFKEHVIDGVCGPGDRCYGIEVKAILEKYKKWEKKKP